ncbi:hypothetical protein Anas_07171 [Armadillidium nasatum]|uniref:Uncharacterized protein n=1 Tax=Armadillidium nasatum TaxID=96803 RepID=A0A5N5SKJ9_9CRUS|nr:hypothetical protein Anas_07171 [Armadillidium nasatum]
MCEPDHSKHLVRRKREPGKALPGETCHLSGNCVEGLYCIADKCQCPNPCEYKKDEGVCDCGEIDYEFPIAAKVLTAVLSILSVCMWTYFILKTKNKHKNTPTNTDENFDVNGPLEMNPLNQPNKPELVGENNFLVPSDLPPSYQESMEERNDCAPFYSPSNAPAANNMSAWKVTPMPGPQNTNTTLTSQYPVSTPYSYGAISDGIHSNDGVSSSSVLSPENVTLDDTSKNQGAALPYPVLTQNNPTPFSAPFAGVHSTASSDATHPNTSEGTSLPYAINPQTMSSTLPPTSTGIPATTSTNATYSNTSEGTSLPYSINPPSAPPGTTEN